MNIAKHSISSVTWNAVANGVKIPVGFIQSVLLARFLPVDTFGIYGGVVALVTLISQIFDFGLNNAFIYRCEETQDEERALSVLFSLRFVLVTIRTVALALLAIFFFSGTRQMVLIVIASTSFFNSLLGTPKVLLMRRIAYQRLAFMSLTSAILTAIFSILIAWISRGIWALLASSIVTLVWMVVVLYLWRPVWVPRFAWDWSIIRYYLNFGGRVQISEFLNTTLDHIDDLWTNLFLGDLALGFYSRSYKFATYPRTFLALPIQTVSNSTYSALKFDRQRLSQAFFRVNALLVRTGFLVSGWLVVIAPQFIALFLGENWLPMLDAFRLLAVFALLDPLKGSLANLLVSIGKPQSLITIRTWQLVILLLALFTLGKNFGIEGVAVAVDLMLLVGIFLLFGHVKPYVDFSIRRLFTAPLFSLSAAGTFSFLVLDSWRHTSSHWLLLAIGSIVFCGIYLLVLILLEGRLLCQSFEEIIRLSPWRDKFEGFYADRK
jgi:O-antigen/teichoic acid export membrane protein